MRREANGKAVTSDMVAARMRELGWADLDVATIVYGVMK